MAADLKHAFDDVSIRGAEVEERWRETESMRAQAMQASSEARKATESIRLRSAQASDPHKPVIVLYICKDILDLCSLAIH